MSDIDQNLANKLQEIIYDGEYLNLCFAWLTYRKIKPVSVIDVPENSQSTDSIVQWFQDAGLSYQKDSTDSDLLHISTDKEKVEIMNKIFREKSPILELIKCEYFGFPIESGYAYLSQMYALPESKRNINAAKTSDVEKNFTDYWKPYISYMMRKGNEQEDSQVAKLWFDTCSQEIPVIHQKFLAQYEADKENNAQKQSDMIRAIEVFDEISQKDKDTLKQVYLRNQDFGWISINTAKILDWLKKARIQYEIDFDDNNMIYITTIKENIDTFRELNSIASKEAKQLRRKYFC